MTSTRLNLLVVRSANPANAVNFYSLLGLEFQEEQHGRGPKHWATTLDGIVFEIYPTEQPEDVDSSTRLGFQVTDVTRTVQEIREAGYEILSEPKSSQWGLRAVICDSDGRRIELLQSATQ